MDCLRNDKPSMTASSTQKRYARNEAEGRVGRGCRANGVGPSQMNEPGQHNMEKEEAKVEVENANDNE